MAMRDPKKKRLVKSVIGPKRVNMSGKAKQNEMLNEMGVKTKFPPRSMSEAEASLRKLGLPRRKKDASN